MAGFSFPPPPPPPPKATSQDASSATNQTQPGGYGQRPGRGGGDRGRGRGRGRGNRGGFGRGGTASNHAAMSHPPQFSRPPPQQNVFNMGSLPAGGHINPAFVNPTLPTAQPWFSQVPSSHTLGYKPPAPTAPSPLQPPSASRPTNKPKVQAAPSVPSFGFALPTSQPQILPNVSREGTKPKKRKANVLGLTPSGDMREDSEEEDVDEEAKFRSTGGALQFEYKGRSSTLKSAEDIAAWIEERRKRFPTKERIAQKQKEEDERRRAREAERKSRYPQQEKDTKKRKRKDDNVQDKAVRKADKLREQLRKAEEAVAKAKAKLEGRATEEDAPKKNLGIDYDSDDSAEQSGEQDAISLADSSSEVSADSDSDSSSSSGGSSEGDAPPEEESSAKRPVKVHLPNRKAPQVTPARPRRDKDKEAPKRVTLRDRMVEQEHRHDAGVVLRFVKMLGEKGMLD
ncbi:ccch zinc finger protein [Diplodia corticola]|uniref:Ccch zinc finger protein n=1 Tax=Diplodia corticola TaxID=236234 RepID=A0A1J9REF2_9PEZI|nr:ccch zinc finger protein [Diplodia corticola]OJD30939.1 ccch zinc finger protein [Diplodia corticola]